jgi:hypothetical protein
MAKTDKIYKVTISNSGKDHSRDTAGTVTELTQYFSYVLEIGNSWNNKIKRGPFTNINALLNNVNKSYAEKEAACFNRTSVDLAE